MLQLYKFVLLFILLIVQVASNDRLSADERLALETETLNTINENLNNQTNGTVQMVTNKQYESWEEFRKHVPYDFYTIQDPNVLSFRQNMKRRVNETYHKWWNQNTPNLREFSEDIYSRYVVNETTGDFIPHNISFILEFTAKDCQKCGELGQLLSNMSADLVQEHYRVAYVDINVDKALAAAFDVKMMPFIWIIDSEDGMAYSWDVNLKPSELFDWILTKKYRNSDKKMKPPTLNTTSYEEYLHSMFSLEANYIRNIAPTFNTLLSLLPKCLSSRPPISYLFGQEKSQIRNQIKVCQVIAALVVILVVKSCVQACCCRKKKVEKEKND